MKEQKMAMELNALDEKGRAELTKRVSEMQASLFLPFSFSVILEREREKERATKPKGNWSCPRRTFVCLLSSFRRKGEQTIQMIQMTDGPNA